MDRAEISVMVNGAQRRVAAEASLLDLLSNLELDPRTVVVELNREIVRRDGLGARVLKAGDSIELVHFVGGG
jgi:thiamine biosynthesis protein ThiS